jgi:hypothetical protein
MEEALRALLTGFAPLTTLVAQRIYWNAIPQDAVDPCVVLYKVAGSEGYHLQGSDGLFIGIVQIDVRALSTTSMWAVSRAVAAKLSGYSDANFRGIFHRGDSQSSEKPGTTLYHRSRQDFDVTYRD